MEEEEEKNNDENIKIKSINANTICHRFICINCKDCVIINTYLKVQYLPR